MREPLPLTCAEQSAWIERLGTRVAFCDRTLLPIYESEDGAITIDAGVSRAAYVVVDADDLVRYVGLVDRAVGMVADRFRGHDHYRESWDCVWVIALADWLTHDQVREVEQMLIDYFDPPDNRINSVAEGKSVLTPVVGAAGAAIASAQTTVSAS